MPFLWYNIKYKEVSSIQVCGSGTYCGDNTYLSLYIQSTNLSEKKPKANSSSDYMFDYSKMLPPKGSTAKHITSANSKSRIISPLIQKLNNNHQPFYFFFSLNIEH